MKKYIQNACVSLFFFLIVSSSFAALPPDIYAKLCELKLAPVSSLQFREHDLGEYLPYKRAKGQGYWKWDKKLDLKSPEGILRLGFWGAGSAFALNQFQSNFVFSKGDTVVYVDLGSKTPIKMAEFGIGVTDIENLIVTHSHADHIGSVEELALKARYQKPFMQAFKEGLTPQKDGAEFFKRAAALVTSGELRPTLYVPHAYSLRLWDESLEGGLGYSEIPEQGKMQAKHYFDVKNPKKTPSKNKRDTWEITIGEGANKIHFVFFIVAHVPDLANELDGTFHTVGMLVDGKVFISGDTRFDPNLFLDFEKEFPRVETIFHDAQSFPGGVHAHVKQLEDLPLQIKERMFLYHGDDGMRPIGADGILGGEPVIKNGSFAGFAEALPYYYEWGTTASTTAPAPNAATPPPEAK